jgi:hypothetical protein
MKILVRQAERIAKRGGYQFPAPGCILLHLWTVCLERFCSVRRLFGFYQHRTNKYGNTGKHQSKCFHFL